MTLLVYVEPAADARDGHAELQEATVRRWQTRCDGARADVKVVVDDSAGRRRESSGASPHPSATPRHGPRATLSHQETELAVARGEVGGDAHGAHPPERYLLALKAEFELKVRSEFWDRPLSLVVRITPKDLVADMVGSTRDAMSSAAPEDGALTDEWFADRLLPLIREDSTPPASLTKRLEYAVKVVNPLQVQVETRALTLGRVGITVKAHNTRDDVVVEVLDLQLHMSEALTVTTSTLSKDEQKPSIGRYELVDDAKTPFPVQLLAQERYNFLFVLAPTQPTIKEHEMSESSENAAPTQLQHERSRGFGGGTAGHDAGPEHALLTLTWRTKGTAVQAITEQHSVIWSPFALSGSDAGATPSTLSASEWGHLVVPQSWAGEGKPLTASSLAFEALRHDSALQVTVTPPAAGARVGEVSTACVAIANRSRRSTFDLTLVVPSGGSAWASFEASHHLGYALECCPLPCLEPEADADGSRLAASCVRARVSARACTCARCGRARRPGRRSPWRSWTRGPARASSPRARCSSGPMAIGRS